MIYADKNCVIIEKACPFCGEECMCEFPADGYEKWMGGELIQRAMPTVPATSREWLISGICPDCQEKIFGEQEVSNMIGVYGYTIPANALHEYLFTDNDTGEDFFVEETSLENAWEIAKEFFADPSFITEVSYEEAEAMGLDTY